MENCEPLGFVESAASEGAHSFFLPFPEPLPLPPGEAPAWRTRPYGHRSPQVPFRKLSRTSEVLSHSPLVVSVPFLCLFF